MSHDSTAALKADHFYAFLYRPLFWLGEKWELFGDLLVRYLLDL